MFFKDTSKKYFERFSLTFQSYRSLLEGFVIVDFIFFKGIFILDEAIRSTHLDIIDATYSNSIRVSSYRYRIIIHEIDLLAKNMK